MSLLGTVRLTRAYYYCPHCRQGHCPWEALVGLTDRDLTPGASEVTALAGVVESFASSQSRLLPRLAGLRLGVSTVERVTEAAGQRVGQQWAAGQTFGDAPPWTWPTDATGQTCVYVSVDATGVGQQGPRGAKADGRMAYVAMLSNAPTTHAGDTRAPVGKVRYLAGLYALDDLGAQLRRQAGQIGFNQAQRCIALSDGGNGLEEFFRVHFPTAQVILDFFHAAEHLHELAQTWAPDQAAELAQQWCHQLKHDGGAAVLATLEALDRRGRSAAARELHRQVTQYVRHNVHRMDYPTYRRNGWLIGSGHIEAACKTVVGQRLKGSGMRWGEAGTDAVCHLRALYLSEPSQWEGFWHPQPA